MVSIFELLNFLIFPLADFTSFSNRHKIVDKIDCLLEKYERVFLIVEKDSGKNADLGISMWVDFQFRGTKIDKNNDQEKNIDY